MITAAHFFLAILAVLGLGTLFVMVRAAVRAYATFNGQSVVICPKTWGHAGVRVDAKHAALTAAFGRAVLRLEECSRWPEKRRCGQVCLDQIEAAPEECRVGTMLATWYRGKSCVYCGWHFAEIHWHDHEPALLGPEGRTFEWSDIPAEAIPRALTTHRPVCWNCHIVETFRREHPNLVVDRPSRVGRDRLAGR